MTALQEAVASLRTDDLQWTAFITPSPCVVLAPPGSGKTRLVTTRLASDLLTRIADPHGAACITMTNAAADELRDRLARLGTRLRPNLFVGTVHAFALAAIVGPYAMLVGRPDIASATLADDGAQRKARAQAVEEILGPNQPPDAIDVVTTIAQRRRLMNYDADAQQLGGPRFARLARRYEELLLADGHYDFEDLVRFAVAFVEQHGWVRRVLAARFPHIYVDEYQDLAPGLDRLVQALCFDERANAELFAVGDPDQAIFGFSGTAPHLLQALAARPTVTAVRLETNFRSHQNVIDTALRHLGEERTVHGKNAGGSVEATECAGGLDHQLSVAQQLIADERARGTVIDEIAVLFRFNKPLDRAVDVLSESLPVFARRDRGYRQTRATALVEAMAAWSVQPRDGRGVKLADLIRRAQRVAKADQIMLSALTGVMLSFRKSPTATATEFVEGVVNCGFAEALQRGRVGEDAIEFSRMRTALSANGPLDGTTVEELGLRARARDRLLLSTIHGSKGLEFDVVIILEVEDGVIPFFKAKTAAEMEEERRTFYVAITRARERVYCLWSPWRMTQYGRRFNGPSPYLVELGLLL